MSFCSNCGQSIANGAKFCSNCGTPVDASSANTQSQRKTVYDGVMHKCPHCGEMLNSFTSICPACGYELRGTAATTSVEKLYKNIQAAKSDSEVVRLVKMFPIPNSREDILEFMVLASSNFNEDHYMAHMGEDSISDAWLSKIEQCHKKARLTLSDEDMLEVDEIYESIKARVAEAKKKANQRYASQQSEVTAKEFKKSKFRIVLVAFAVISVLFCMLAFQNGRILAGIVSALMVGLFLTAFLMGSGVINERVRNFRLVPAILAFLLFVPYFSLSDSNNTNHNTEKTTERFDWPEAGLGLLLPEPETNIGEIIFDEADANEVSGVFLDAAYEVEGDSENANINRSSLTWYYRYRNSNTGEYSEWLPIDTLTYRDFGAIADKIGLKAVINTDYNTSPFIDSGRVSLRGFLEEKEGTYISRHLSDTDFDEKYQMLKISYQVAEPT